MPRLNSKYASGAPKR